MLKTKELKVMAKIIKIHKKEICSLKAGNKNGAIKPNNNNAKYNKIFLFILTDL